MAAIIVGDERYAKQCSGKIYLIKRKVARMEHEYQDLTFRTEYLRASKIKIKKDIHFYKAAIAKLVRLSDPGFHIWPHTRMIFNHYLHKYSHSRALNSQCFAFVFVPSRNTPLYAYQWRWVLLIWITICFIYLELNRSTICVKIHAKVCNFTYKNNAEGEISQFVSLKGYMYLLTDLLSE